MPGHGTSMTFALARVRRWSSGRLVATFAALAGVSVATLLVVHRAGIALFSAQLVVWAALEVVHARAAPAVDRRWLWRMVGCFALGFGFWLADQTGACDPNNHLVNGHALWHLATSACLYLFFRFEASLAG